jgi:hypothetical protein
MPPMSDTIQEAVDKVHEGAEFLHEVATGPATGAGSTVTNPVDATEQETVAKAIKAASDAMAAGGDHVSYAGAQSKSVSEKLTALQNIGIPSLPRLAKTVSRLYDMSSTSHQGTSRNWLTYLAMGDSMCVNASPYMFNVLKDRIGVAGLALEALLYKTISGTVVFAGSNAQRRTDVWGSGNCRQLQNGAVVQVADVYGGATIYPLWADDIAVYLVAENGGGTLDIEYSDDNGSSWNTLESGVDTDNSGASALMLKTYNIGGTKLIILRLTVTSGNVELIGCRMSSVDRRGALLARSASGGNTTENYAQADQTIFQGVMADLQPDLLHYHDYSSDTDWGTYAASLASSFATAAPEADILWNTQHEQDATSDKEDNINPYARAIAASIPRVSLWETEEWFGGYDNLADLGWNTSDPIHLEAEAWMYQATLICTAFGLAPGDKGENMFQLMAQTGASRAWYTKTVLNAAISYFFMGSHNFDISISLGWRDDDEGDMRYWRLQRIEDDHANNPNGFLLTTYPGAVGSYKHPMQVSALGRFYISGSSSEVDVDAQLARFALYESTSTIATIQARHYNDAGDALRIKDGSDSRAAGIKGNGDADFRTERLGVFAFANLPSGTQGQRCFCNDSNQTLAAGIGTALAAGGANFVPCFYDGSQWVIG